MVIELQSLLNSDGRLPAPQEDPCYICLHPIGSALEVLKFENNHFIHRRCPEFTYSADAPTNAHRITACGLCRLPLETNERLSCSAIVMIVGFFLSLIMAAAVVIVPVFIFPTMTAGIVTLVCALVIWAVTAWLIHTRNNPPA